MIRYKYNCVDDINILDYYSNDYYFKDWYKIVHHILRNKEFQKRRLFMHHENESLWTHSIKVSFESYKFAIRHGINSYNCAVAGLLHDFYTEAWQYTEELESLNEKYRRRFIEKRKEKFTELHGIHHPIVALENSRKYFKKYLNKNIENAIATHMFPLSIFTEYKVPNCKESFVVTLIDKKVSINMSNVKELSKYVGLRKLS